MRSRAVVASVVMLAALVSGGALLQRGLERSDNVYNRARLFDDVLTHVEQFYVDSLSEAALYTKATEGMLDELHDPYSVYLTPERLARLNESTSGTYAGLGVQIDVRDGWITVVAPLPGTPAERAGIQPGDRIVAIDGKSTEGWSGDEARAALRGGKGSTVQLQVERPGVAARIPFALTRTDIHVRSVRHDTMLTPDVGYVDLNIFSEASADELRTAITSLRQRGMKTLVLDMRANPGGLLEQGVSIADLFLDAGQRIVSMRGRALGATREFADDRAQLWPDLEIVALVDDHSASATEIVAGALQDHDRAVIVGTTTYGKGSAQSVYAIRDQGGALKLTTARWFTPSGRSIQKSLAHADSDSDDPPADTTSERPLADREAYKTDMGRTVYGGGGITPDLIVESSDSLNGTLAFYRMLGPAIPRFRDALTEYALQLKATHAVTTPEFSTTPAMRAELARHLRAHAVPLTRAQLDSAATTVDPLIETEIARYVFGPDAEFRRRAAGDRVIQTALELAAGARSEKDLLARAAARRAAKREDVPQHGS